LPVPEATLRVEHRGRDPEAWGPDIDRWLDEAPCGDSPLCLAGSVQPRVFEALATRLRRRGLARIELLTAAHLPLTVRTKAPQRVGIDRLLAAVAVNRLRAPGTPAISIDMGTATTVDAIAADGAFEGGAILAGPWLSLLALHQGTASLPEFDVASVAAPPAVVGKSTDEALASGAFWGAVGAVSELVRRTARDSGADPELYLTGGAAPAFQSFIALDGRPARHVPHLVLCGVRIAAESRAAP
jgi:type III pantothenate kinase